MKRMNPNLKIFAFMTDPVSRLFSHLNMCIRKQWYFCKKQTLEQVMAKVTNYLSKYNSTNFVESDEMKFGAFHRLIQSSNYALVTEIYQNYFSGNVHFVDGLNLLRKRYQKHNKFINEWLQMISLNSSGSELKLLIEFFGLDSSMMNWRFHPDKKFLCLYQPVKFCLRKSKGSTRDASSVDYDQELVNMYPELNIWRVAFRDQMVKMYQQIFQCKTKESCCMIKLSNDARWRWLRKYYCDLWFYAETYDLHCTKILFD